MQVQDAAPSASADAAQVIDAAPLPVTLDDLFLGLPRPPPPALASVGEELTKLAGQTTASPFTPRIQIQGALTGRAFRGAQYLTEGGQIRAVLMTFEDLYAQRSAAVEAAIKARLGEGERALTTTYEGRSWRTLDQQITLRTDRVTGDLELLFQRQGP